jgi:hypothetical protein
MRGNAAAHGLSFPSGRAMVIFAITALVAPYLKGWWKVLPWALAAATYLSRAYLGAHIPPDVVAEADLGILIGGRAEPGVRRAQHQFQHSQREPVPVRAGPSTPRRGRVPPYTRLPRSRGPQPRLTPFLPEPQATDHGGQAMRQLSGVPSG